MAVLDLLTLMDGGHRGDVVSDLAINRGSRHSTVPVATKKAKKLFLDLTPEGNQSLGVSPGSGGRDKTQGRN
ncbi:hypothetical protein TGRH88_033730 [Toxoplasma gondii]|uniref:Uncharacterized protein n=1 Tax=Toxoplasma gondii TaxID=5811 RepID=A0A7J6K6F3_TOXGO|nr:hypothetical protein TGRH88_033730 [Toxoplasma gondii]